MKHTYERHRFYSKYLGVSKFAKGMNKSDIKRLILQQWKMRKSYGTTYFDRGKQVWEIKTGKFIGFTDKGSKTGKLKIIVEPESGNLISAYPQ